MPPHGAMGRPRPKLENPGKIFRRIMGYMLRSYTPHCILVLICILVSVFASLQGTLFMKTLIDGYITPLLLSPDKPDFHPLAMAIVRVAAFYLLGAGAGF